MTAPDGGAPPAKRGALKLTLTEPESVPMTPQQHRQAVDALSAMILTWLQRQRDTAASDPGDGSAAGDEDGPEPSYP
jgi:hypothetical protein